MVGNATCHLPIIKMASDMMHGGEHIECWQVKADQAKDRGVMGDGAGWQLEVEHFGEDFEADNSKGCGTEGEARQMKMVGGSSGGRKDPGHDTGA